MSNIVYGLYDDNAVIHIFNQENKAHIKVGDKTKYIVHFDENGRVSNFKISRQQD